jgi:murein L,D-transpeptidase YafK
MMAQDTNRRQSRFDPEAEANAVKHRNWVRFLGLSVASAASLCLGAFLSYQAAMQAESAEAPASGVAALFGSAGAENAAAETPAISDQTATVKSAPVKPGPVKTAEAPAPAPENPRLMVLASLQPDNLPIFSSSGVFPGGLAGPSSLRTDDAPPASPSPAQESALPENDLATPANPQSLAAASAPLPEGQALFHGKPAPLPPVRPASLKVPTTIAALIEASPVAIPAPPVGAQPVIGPSPTVSAAPAAPGAAVSPAATAPASPAALAAPAKATPPAASMAAAASPGSFPGVANALAAVTASIGGANAAVTPGQPSAEVLPDDNALGGFKKGSPAYVRIFKKEGVLELWLKRGDNYALYKSYPVCKWSGQLGPKTRQADYQSPEGFYSVSARQLNPNSHYHLAFDIGYPNAYDRRQGSTGSAVMVHGDCKSVGCFAMTNNGIDEIYGIVEAALRNGQREVPVHIFPFRMTEEAIARESSPKQFMAFLTPVNAQPQRDWSGFWRNLKEGYDMFQRSHVPPVAYACGDRYDFGAGASSCSRIAGW